MSTFVYFLAIAVMFVVLLVLGRGLWNMMRGGNPNLSNKLMQMRVALQALALFLIMLFMWLSGGGRS